jgi:hypothetical protein
VVDEKHNDRPNDGDEHAVDVQTSDWSRAHQGEEKAADDGTDYAEHYVKEQPLAGLVDDFARNEAGDQSEDKSSDDRHRISFHTK